MRDTLASIGCSAAYIGDDAGRANAYDVALLDLFAIAVHGISHAFAVGAAEGISATELAPFAAGIGSLLPEMATRFASQIDAGRHPGDRSTIASAGASIDHIIAAAARHGIDTGALAAARATIQRAVAEGHGQDGLSYLTTAIQNSAARPW